ncbi:MAG TPA: hypothetical protein VNJ52_07270 [Patescibacteria group bacterium]|nr:hypothetical protein [Patescibacteria group bacterium]
MSATGGRKSKAAEELNEALKSRDAARIEAERRGLKNLNQGMDATGHDATHRGINWGPSYKTRRKAKAKKSAK